MTGRSIVRTRRTGGTKPLRDAILHDADHDLLDECTLPDAVRHARKLCGLLPYSLSEVKPTTSARYIFMLIRMNSRLMDSKSVARTQALKDAVRAQRKELVRLWRIESEYKALTAQTELPFNGGGE